MTEAWPWLVFLFQHLHVFQMSDLLFTSIKIWRTNIFFLLCYVPIFSVKQLARVHSVVHTKFDDLCSNGEHVKTCSEPCLCTIICFLFRQ
jgi:hypothetical protein